MASVRSTYGFVSSGADLWDRSGVLSTSMGSIFAYPLSAYACSGYPMPSGARPLHSVRLVTEGGEELSLSPGPFAEYGSAAYDASGASPEFSAAFSSAAARYKCAVATDGRIDDLWLLFDTSVPSEMVDFVTHMPSMWWVRRGDADSAERIAMSLSDSARTKIFEAGAEAYRYFFASYPPEDGSSPNSSCCFVAETSAWYGDPQDDGPAKAAGRQAAIGSVQHGLTGITALGGTPAHAGKLVRLGPDGLFDESVLPASYQGFATALAKERDARIAADSALSGRIDEKQDELSFDDEPTEGSTNPVTSGGVYSAIEESASKVYRFKGSVDSYGDLPSEGNSVGDVWNVKSDDMNYAWADDSNDGYWDPLGPTLSGYATKADATLTERSGYTDEWKCSPAVSPNGSAYRVYWDEDYGTWMLEVSTGADFLNIGRDATSFTHEVLDEYSETVTGTRVPNTGYQLGDQADKPLAPAGDYALKSELPDVPVKAVKRNGTKLVPDAQGAVDVEVPTTAAAVGAVNKAGDTMTGGLTVPNLTVGSRADGSAVGTNSVAEGEATTASSRASHAEGSYSTASGESSHAEGEATTASAFFSHAEGDTTTASGNGSHTEGLGTTASGDYSHAEGMTVTAQNEAEHAQGAYNVSHTGSTNAEKTIHSIGVGAFDVRVNAVEVMRDGKVFIKDVGSYTGQNNPTGSGVSDLATVVNGKMPASATGSDIRVNTNVQTTVAAAISSLESGVNAINGKIPPAASSSNQLADKAFVTDSITQGTAVFRGSFATKAALDAVQWQTADPSGANFVSNNDYAVVLDDETHSDECWRYLYVVSSGSGSWTAQYRINESPLTQAQQDALNSGVTAAVVAKANSAVQPADLSTVATTGSYNDLSNKPTIPTSFDKIVSQDGKTSVVASDNGTAVLKTDGASIGDNDPLSDMADYLGLGDNATLDDVRQALGLPETATLDDARHAVPTSSEKTIATIDDLEPKLDADQRNIVPYAASADLTLDPVVSVYRLSPTGTSISIPSPVTTALPATDGYYQFEIELAVPATATSLTAPSGWTWLTGFGLPSSGYAGKTVYVSCRMDLRGNAVTASCWRVA